MRASLSGSWQQANESCDSSTYVAWLVVRNEQKLNGGVSLGREPAKLLPGTGYAVERGGRRALSRQSERTLDAATMSQVPADSSQERQRSQNAVRHARLPR